MTLFIKVPLNQTHVAAICGISRERVSQLARGINRNGTTRSRGSGPMTLEQILERYPAGRQWLKENAEVPA